MSRSAGEADARGIATAWNYRSDYLTINNRICGQLAGKPPSLGIRFYVSYTILCTRYVFLLVNRGYNDRVGGDRCSRKRLHDRFPLYDDGQWCGK